MEWIAGYVRQLDALGPWSHAALGLLAALLATALTALCARVLVAVADRFARRTANTRDDQLLGRVRGPLALFAPAVGIHVLGAWLQWPWVTGAAELISGLLFTYVVVASFEILVLESWLETRHDIRVPAPVRQLVISVVYGAVLLGLAGDAFGFDVTPLLATGSVTTVILGFALQGPLSNLFAGIVLHVEDHPRPGEWVLRYHDDAESEFLKRLWYRFQAEGVAFPARFQGVRMVEGAGPRAGLEPQRPEGGFPARAREEA